MLTQLLSTLRQPIRTYYCVAFAVVLAGLIVVPLQPSTGKGNGVEPTFASYSAPMVSPPTVSLSTPTNNASFIADATIVLNATAVDPYGIVSNVEFFQGLVKLGEDTTAPYSYDWTNVAAGDYVLTARATYDGTETTTSGAVNISVFAQVKQFVGWSSITNGIDLGGGSLRKTSTGAWDFYASSLQMILPGDAYFESTAANYNQSISLMGSDGTSRSMTIGSGSWVGINEDGQEVAATCCHIPSETISPHVAGDRYRIEITNSVLRYIRYRSASREVMFTSAAPLPVYPILAGLGMSPQNAEWQKTVIGQFTRKATWSSIVNGIDMGNGSVKKTSTGAWDFSATAAQKLQRGDGYFESTASYWNHSINLTGANGASRSLVLGSGGWAAIYENGQEVANTSPLMNLTPHAAGDRYRLEITNNTLCYVRYRAGLRAVIYTSANPVSAYPLSFSLGASFQNSEWQNTVFAQLSQTVTWSYISNGIDLGNGSVRKTSTGVWDFGAGPRQQLVGGSGFFESTSSYWNHSIATGGANSAGGALVLGTGGWGAIYENGGEVANTSPMANIAPHAAGDRYRLEITRGKLRYVRYRGGVRSIMFTSANLLPAYALSFSLGASFQNSEWQNTIFTDNIPDFNNASFVAQTVPATMVPGQTYSVSVTMRNNGASTWTPDGDYQLASENLPDNQRWGPSRINLTSTVLPGSDGTFSFTVTAPATGSHSFQWRLVQQGVERFGALSTNVDVQTVNGAPSVSLTSPANNAVFTAGATVALSASASDNDGTVIKVEFFQGATKLGEDTSVPYTYNWPSVSAGSYVLTARATDNGGATAISSAVNVTVNPPNQPPTVTLTSPANNAIFTAVATIPLTANAADNDGVVNKVEFFRGTVKLGEDTSVPYSFNWTNVSAGTYALTARATDNAGATTTSSVVNIIVNQPPTVVLTSPPDMSPFTAVANIFLSANASDTDGTVSKVEFYQGTVKLGEDDSVPYNFNWTNVSAGTYVLFARAIDNLGATGTSNPVNITVNQPPTVALTSPANNATFPAGATIALNANASDSGGGTVTKVEFFKGSDKLGEDTTSPYAFNWVNVGAGSYILTARATDNGNATTTSGTVSIIVNAPPVANSGGPYSGLVGSQIQFNGSGTDSDGQIVSYHWNFGDGSTANTANATHAYATANSFTATLTVTDNLNATGSAQASVSVSDGSIARLEPLNRTGGAGEDPLSRNYNWSVRLLELPGRAGLDLSLSLAYNSLATWTRNGSVMSFDDDHGFPGPGFRLGFPVIQSRFFNSQAGKFAFLVIGPDGTRAELRQVGSSNRYQSVDSSYMLLEATSETAMTLRTADGSQLSYVLYGSDFQCTQIKDRNGNFITASYDTSGRITAVVDTLNRTVNFNYDYEGLKDITQTWVGQAEPRRWASFSYENRTLQSNFPGLGVTPPNNSPIHVLKRVTLDDNSYHSFEYTAWGQIWKITNVAATGDVLSYRAYNLPGDLPPHSDCPRFTEKHDWVQNWNSNASGVEVEVHTQFTVTSSASWTMPDGTPQTGLSVRVTLPDLTSQKFYFPTGWQRGLASLVETYDSGNVKQRWTFISRTQDATNVSYLLNPRVKETNTYDPAGNRARTRTEYSAFPLDDGTTINLASDTYEYQANATTVLRHSHTEYKMTAPYTERRIIGLVRLKTLHEGDANNPPATLMSKVESFFDDDGSIEGYDTPVQHDSSYGHNFATGRGNVSRITRFDVNNSAQSTTSAAKYNTAGSVVLATDALNHPITISYVDSFADGLSRNTLAYPTTVNDGDGYSSTWKYNYNFGAATYKQTPLPNTTANLPGPAQTLLYDSLGRIERINNLANNSYTRFEYPSSGNRLDTYVTLEAEKGEAHSIEIADGVGRVIAKAGSHPGSLGGFSGQLTFYDKMGRVMRTSNPTETTASSASGKPYDWPATGDDATAGWIYTQQTHDWKGRPLVTTNPSTTGNPTQTTTRQASYSGCGCAGGEVVTLTDEIGRQQKTYSDVLGRPRKTEVLTSSGAVYSTAVNSYNVRDQITSTREFQGAAPSDPNDLSCPGSTVVGTLVSDSSWKQSEKIYANWNAVDFDDSSWGPAFEEGAYGEPPWEAYTGFPINTPAQWIWHYDARYKFGTSDGYFRKTFVASSSSATLTVQGLLAYNAWLNGMPLGNGNQYMPPQKMTLTLIPGETYVLGIYAAREGGPGGVLAHLEFTDGACQQTTMDYDGYGRLQSKHVPKQQPGTATSYSYNADDTLNSVTDARGAVATYSYNNNRRLLSGISYWAPAGITATPAVLSVYDAAGNRTSTSDGSGSTTFVYSDLSQVISETRTLVGLGSGYNIGYGYNLGGGLKTITYPNGASINYDFDSAGRPLKVTGSPAAGVTEYISEIKYRAWGGRKEIHYKNDNLLELNYTARLKLQRYHLKGPEFQGQRTDAALVEQQYADDGRKSFSHDFLDERFNRWHQFDLSGRLTAATSGVFSQVYEYDAFNNMTNRISQIWSQSDSFSSTYLNGRNQLPGWQYDAEGHLRFDNDFEYKYDARGGNTTMRKLSDSSTVAQVEDVEGDIVKRTQFTVNAYYVRSTVLDGKVVCDLNHFGTVQKNYIYLEGEVLATQDNNTFWRHENPLTGGRGESNFNGGLWRTVEPDSMGVNVGFSDPFNLPPEPPSDPDLASLFPSGESGGRCRLNGVVFPCVSARRLAEDGTAARCSNCESFWNEGGIGYWDQERRRVDPGDLETLDRKWILEPVFRLRASRSNVTPTSPTPNGKPPCSSQDFTFSQGTNGLTADELSQIAQTAVGESSAGRFYENEASTIIDIIENRLGSNIYGSEHNWISRGDKGAIFDINRFSGGATSVAGILREFDAASPGKDGLRSGERKLAGAKRENNGVLAADSYVCKQLLEARSNAARVGDVIAAHGKIVVNRGVNSNLGLGPRQPANFELLFTIGDTRFGRRPYVTRRPSRR